MLELIRLLYLALFLLLIFPVGWASGLYFVTLFGNERAGWLGFAVSTLFLASPFIVSSARTWVRRKRREASEDA